MYLLIPDSSGYFGSTHEERNSDVEVVRHGLALHQSVLPQVVAVVWGEQDVGVL